MRSGLFLAIIYLFVNRAIAQEDASFQPSGIYQAQRVKSRTEVRKHPYRKNAIYINRSGIITEIVDEQEQGITKREFIYDSTGKLVKEQDTFHFSLEGTRKKHSSGMATDSFVVFCKDYFYDESGSLQKARQERSLNGSDITIVFQCNPSLQVRLENYTDGKTITDSIFFDTALIAIREKTIMAQPGKAPEILDMKFKNYYDEQGRIIKRERIIEGVSQIDPYKFDTEEFRYNKKGLLIEIIYKNLWATVKELFVYEYWD